MESYEIQALRDVVKTGGEEVLEKLEKKFIYIRFEGKRKSPSSTMFTKTLEKLPVTHYMEKELKKIYTMYMGTSPEGRKIFQGNSLNRGRGNSFSRGQGNSYYRSQSRDRDRSTDSRYGGYNPRSRYNNYREP